MANQRVVVRLVALPWMQPSELHSSPSRPATTCPSRSTPTFTNPQIHAAMLALGHSFIVQNYDEGAQLGTITVNGGIAQKWRGPVGTSGGTGYLKNYGYDSRLQYASPRGSQAPASYPDT